MWGGLKRSEDGNLKETTGPLYLLWLKRQELNEGANLAGQTHNSKGCAGLSDQYKCTLESETHACGKCRITC